MNFFEHQDVARRKTKWLVIIYVITVVMIVVGVHAAVCAGLFFSNLDKGAEQVETVMRYEYGDFDREPTPREAHTYAGYFWHPGIFGLVAMAVLFVVFLGSAYKRYEMRAGGRAIAEWLGGRQIFYESERPMERKIWNVVEEMAIASGIPMPTVYLLERENGINAFAAGMTIDDAVIGVTKGCVEQLSRDELQGVIAHEFSHIFHGDMRLNMRLISVLAGITLLSYIGYIIFRGSAGSGSGRRSSSGKKGGGGQIMLVGLAIYVIGAVGAFAAAIIQSAISRQREFLADASAVQFTRNPVGISGALRAIGRCVSGARVESVRSGEVRHMFFGQGVKTWFATHPPLRKRISRIETGADGATVEGLRESTPGGGAGLAGVAGFSAGHGAGETIAAESPIGTELPSSDKVALLASIGDPHEEHVSYAQRLLKRIPEDLLEAAHECYTARAVVYGLLIDAEPATRAVQLNELRERTDETLMKRLEKMLPELAALPAHLRVPLLDIAKGVLKEMTLPQFQQFSETIDVLIEVDQRLSVFEWVVRKSLISHLDAYFNAGKRLVKENLNIKQCVKDVRLLLSTIAHAGHKHAPDALVSFEEAADSLGARGLAMTAREGCSLSELDDSMDRLRRLRPAAKEKLIGGCIRSVASDGKVSQMEAELLRVFSETLGCPVPPLLPGQQFAV